MPERHLWIWNGSATIASAKGTRAIAKTAIAPRSFRSARQLLIGKAGRPIGSIAQATALILFISLEIALEPFDMAVALEGEDVGSDAIEKPPVVTYDHSATRKRL